MLILTSPIDDFVMSNLRAYNKRDIVDAEQSELDFLDGDDSTAADAASARVDAAGAPAPPLSPADEEELAQYILNVLFDKVRTVKVTKRLVDSPAIVTGHESASLRRISKLVQHQVSEAERTARLSQADWAGRISQSVVHSSFMPAARACVHSTAAPSGIHIALLTCVREALLMCVPAFVRLWMYQGEASVFDEHFGGRPRQQLEINPKHPIIRGLWARVQAERRAASPTPRAPVAGEEGVEEIGTPAAATAPPTPAPGTGAGTTSTVVVKQLLDNALITAGLVDDPRRMLAQLNELMLQALGGDRAGEQQQKK